VRLALALLVACGTPVEAPKPQIAKSVQLNKPGEMVDIDAILPAGYVTVIDFWAEWCGGCIVVGGMLAVGVAKEPDIVIRKIDVGEGTTPVAHAYQINVLPHFRIYDKKKTLRYELVANDCTKATDLAKELAAEP
jgi:thiol-disulfide isomerase/thioredoxin